MHISLVVLDGTLHIDILEINRFVVLQICNVFLKLYLLFDSLLETLFQVADVFNYLGHLFFLHTQSLQNSLILNPYNFAVDF